MQVLSAEIDADSRARETCGIGELYARRRPRSRGPADEDEQTTSTVEAELGTRSTTV
jgi:hypothetical protein